MKNLFNRIRSNDLLFYLAVILAATPVWWFKFFGSLDGPAHLHNANLLQLVVSGTNPVIDTFYKVNPVPVPNWLSHIILSLLCFVFPGFLAEKVILLLYVIGLPVIFRKLLLRFSPENHLLSYLVIPFIYTFMFYLGLYNFCLSLILFFAVIFYWFKIVENINTKNIFLMLLFVTLLYFAHIITWVLLFFTLLTLILIPPKKPEGDIPKSSTGKKLTYLFIIYLPAIAFVFEYLGATTLFFGNAMVPFEEKIKWLREVRPVIAYNYENESIYTPVLFFWLQAMFLIAIYNRFSSIRFPDEKITFTKRIGIFLRDGFHYHDIWLLLSGFILFIYFNIPNSISFIIGGFALEKLCLFFYLFFIFWLSMQRWPRWIRILGVLVVCWTQFQLMALRWNATRELNENAKDCNSIAEFIEPNSVVLPVCWSENWLHAHFSNYMGIDKPIMLLENYEAGDGYFPLVWKYNRVPDLKVDTTDQKELCMKWSANPNNPPEPIPYILILGNEESRSDSCATRLKDVLKESYSMVYSTKITQLYKYSKVHL